MGSATAQGKGMGKHEDYNHDDAMDNLSAAMERAAEGGSTPDARGLRRRRGGDELPSDGVPDDVLRQQIGAMTALFERLALLEELLEKADAWEHGRDCLFLEEGGCKCGLQALLDVVGSE